MSWRMIIVGAVGGFAWLFVVQALRLAQAIPLSGAAANWLILGGLGVVWAAVMLLAERSKNEG